MTERGRLAPDITFTIRPPFFGSFGLPWEKYDSKIKLYRSRILLAAAEAGFRDKGVADRNEYPELVVRIMWGTRHPRIAWEDIYRGIKDALWYDGSIWIQPGEGSWFSCEYREEKIEVVIRYGGRDA